MEMLKVRLQLTDWFPFLFFVCLFSLSVVPPEHSTPSVFLPSLPPFHVLHAPTFPQLEMAIENLQKSEGIATHKSSLLNSHVSQTGKKLYWNWNKSWKKGLVHPACLFALLFTAAVSMLFPEQPLALCILGLKCLRPPAFTLHHWFSQHPRDHCVYMREMYSWTSSTKILYLRILYIKNSFFYLYFILTLQL